MTAAHFQLSSTISVQTKSDYVDNVITALGLAKARDTVIGDERIRGVSGGERKRANIGELMSIPEEKELEFVSIPIDRFS